MSTAIKSPLEDRLKAWHGEEWHTSKGRIIRDVVYSLDTGLVTAVSFLAGASVALLSRDRLIGASLIQIVSGTVANFFGAYISTKAQKHFFENQLAREEKEIEDDPAKETQEIRIIFQDMGFTREEQEIAVKRITSDKKRWLYFMAQEEIGITPAAIDNPLEIGLVSAISFLIGTVPALLPFLVIPDRSQALLCSAVVVALFLFFIGVFKTKLTKLHWFQSGIETLGIGVLSCGSGFLLGRLVATIID